MTTATTSVDGVTVNVSVVDVGIGVEIVPDAVVAIQVVGGPGPAGTTILNGEVPPPDDTGALEDYYFDKTAHVLYGPKKLPTVAVPEPVALLQNNLPSAPVLGVSTNFWEEGTEPVSGTIGNKIEFTASGQITALRYFAFTYELFGEDAAGMPPFTDPVTLTLWDESATLVVTTTVARGIGGWIVAELETPIDVLAGQQFYVGADVSADDLSGAVFNSANKIALSPDNMTPLSYGNMTGLGLHMLPGSFGCPTEPLLVYPEEEEFEPFIPLLACIDTIFTSGFIPTTLFTTQNKPMDAESGYGTTLGNRIQFAADGQVTALRYFYLPEYFDFENQIPADVTLRLWSDSGKLLASGTTHCEQYCFWYEAILDSPIDVIAGQYVRVAVDLTDVIAVGSYQDSGYYFYYYGEEYPDFSLTNAHMTAISGCFFEEDMYNYDYGYGLGSYGFPAKLIPTLFFVDAVFSATVGPWPIALISGGEFVSPIEVIEEPPPPPFEPWVRESVSLGYDTLDPGASYSSWATLAPGYRILQIETPVPTRFRMYTDYDKREADINRPIGTDPVGDHGCLIDFISTDSMLYQDLVPAVDGYNASGTSDSYFTITNVSNSQAEIWVSLTWIRTE